MSKRRVTDSGAVGDSGPVTVDSDDDTNSYDHPGVFKQASEAEVASRRMVKARTSRSGSNLSNAPAGPSSGFGGVSLFPTDVPTSTPSFGLGGSGLAFGQNIAGFGTGGLPTFGAGLKLPVPGAASTAPNPVQNASTPVSFPSFGLPVAAAGNATVAPAPSFGFGFGGNSDSSALPKPTTGGLPASDTNLSFGVDASKSVATTGSAFGVSMGNIAPITSTGPLPSFSFTSNVANLPKSSLDAKKASAVPSVDTNIPKQANRDVDAKPTPAAATVGGFGFTVPVASSTPAPAPAIVTSALVSTPAKPALAGDKPQPAGGASKTADNTKAHQFYRAVASLNRSFFEWVVKQYAANPLCVWSAGLADYAEHVKRLEAELGPSSSYYTEKPAASGTIIPAATPAKPESPAPVVAKPASAPIPTATPAPAPTSTASFNFGAPISAPAPAPAPAPTPTASFNFGAPISAPAPAPAPAPTSTASFNFGAPISAPAPAPAPTPTASFNFGAPISAPATAFGLGAPPVPSDKPAASTPSQGTFSFNFGAPTPSPAPAAGVELAIPAPAPTGTSSGGFASFQGFGGNVAAGDDGSGDDEPAGNPEDNIQTVAKPSTQAGEECVYDTRAKIMRLDLATKEWKDIGIGNIRIYANAAEKQARLAFGTSAGRTFLSGYLLKGMLVERGGKNNVNFTFLHDGKLQKFVAKNKTADVANNLAACLVKYKEWGL